MYIDDSVLSEPEKPELEQIVKDLKELVLDVTEEGYVSDFLGINIERRP